MVSMGAEKLCSKVFCSFFYAFRMENNFVLIFENWFSYGLHLRRGRREDGWFSMRNYEESLRSFGDDKKGQKLILHANKGCLIFTIDRAGTPRRSFRCARLVTFTWKLSYQCYYAYLYSCRQVLVKLYTLQLIQMRRTVVSHPLHSVAYLTYQQKVFDLIRFFLFVRSVFSIFMNIERREREIRQEGAIGVDGLLELLPDEVMCDQLFHNNESTGREIEMVVGGPRGRELLVIDDEEN